MTTAPIWLVDDDRTIRIVLATALRDAGFEVRAFERAQEVRDALESGDVPALLFTDVRMPGEGGLALLDGVRALHPELPVVVMSAWTDIASTAAAFRGGAVEFLSKPFDLDAAVALATRVLGDVAHVAEPADAGSISDPTHDQALIGDAPAMRTLFRAIGRLAQAPLSVLVTGETGTGKELVARALHRESPRAARAFVAINTAAIPSELLEAELFGHEAGAFTGATRRQVGRFEQAHGGTLFLDEIGDMPLSLQTRLLRVLAEGEFFRVGGRELVRVDVRVLAATHQDLDARVRDGRFRADLLHRLDVVRLHLPPLRERIDDVPQLAERFLARASRRFDAAPKRLHRDAIARLQAHAWPGNVRELENACWRLAALAAGDVIRARDVDDSLAVAPTSTQAPVTHGSSEGVAMSAASASVDAWTRALNDWADAQLAAHTPQLHAQASAAMDRVLLEAALRHTQGRRAEAASRLGLGRNTLTRKLKPTR